MKYVLSESGKKEAVLIPIKEWECILNEQLEIKHFLMNLPQKYPPHTENLAAFQQKIEAAREQFNNKKFVADSDLDSIISTW